MEVAVARAIYRRRPEAGVRFGCPGGGELLINTTVSNDARGLCRAGAKASSGTGSSAFEGRRGGGGCRPFIASVYARSEILAKTRWWHACNMRAPRYEGTYHAGMLGPGSVNAFLGAWLNLFSFIKADVDLRGRAGTSSTNFHALS